MEWWERYLTDPAWRIEQELPAHKREYQAFCEMRKDRNARARYLRGLAERISGPLYGNAISFNQARRWISA